MYTWKVTVYIILKMVRIKSVPVRKIPTTYSPKLKNCQGRRAHQNSRARRRLVFDDHDYDLNASECDSLNSMRILSDFSIYVNQMLQNMGTAPRKSRRLHGLRPENKGFGYKYKESGRNPIDKLPVPSDSPSNYTTPIRDSLENGKRKCPDPPCLPRYQHTPKCNFNQTSDIFSNDSFISDYEMPPGLLARCVPARIEECLDCKKTVSAEQGKICQKCKFFVCLSCLDKRGVL